MILFLLILSTFISCGSQAPDISELNFQYNVTPEESNSEQNTIDNNENPEEPSDSIKYLALGDSYTIGTSVCETCRYPAQLKKNLQIELDQNIDLKIIAQSGWTTTNLQKAINTGNPSKNYNLVTLLIGVNNQYQGRNFNVYKKEFPELLEQAIEFANNIAHNVVVISIPDYAYTPFGQSTSASDKISREIDNYNSFAEQTALEKGAHFINITDITRNGLIDSSLIASDKLHPSEKAYTLFTERLLPICNEILNKIKNKR